MKLKIDQKQLRRFRMRALKRVPKEYIEALYGYLKNGRMVVTNFRSVAQVAGPGHVSYRDGDWPAVWEGKILLGDIHSHLCHLDIGAIPDCAPSEEDWADTKDRLVIGICVVEPPGVKPRTRVKWYRADGWIQEVK